MILLGMAQQTLHIVLLKDLSLVRNLSYNSVLTIVIE